ncbi:MAG: hypothetical protein ABJA98_19255 [Acidobacteriota bacterium]
MEPPNSAAVVAAAGPMSMSAPPAPIDFATAANGLCDILGGTEDDGEYHSIVSSHPSRGFPSDHLVPAGARRGRVDRLEGYGVAPMMLRPALHVRYVVANERGGASVPLRAGAVLAQWSVPNEHVDGGGWRWPPDAMATVRTKLARFALPPTLLLAASDGPVRNGRQLQALWRFETFLELKTLGDTTRLSQLLSRLSRAVESDELGGTNLLDLWVQLPGSRLKVAPYNEIAVCLEMDVERTYAIDALERACREVA